MLLLYPFSVLYLMLWLLRRCTALPAEPLQVPVLVVGNHVVGGAGKTPTVIALVQALIAAGRRPGVISRGHGRQGSAPQAVQLDSEVAEVGDEPLLIRRRTGVPVWVGRARREAGLALTAAHPDVDVLVSDDGLQHMALNRQAELVVFDERGVGNGFLLPAGPLREPLPADVPPWMRVLYTAGVASTALPGTLATRRLGLAWPLAAWHAGDASLAQPLASLQGRPFTAAAGLAAPEKFFGMLRAAGLDFKPLPLPDHHAYARLPWPAGTADVVTTEKDAIKLQPARVGATRVWVVPLDLDIPPALVGELLALLPAPAPAAPTAP
jgi:tetraacyldisaccharide 4'-kinase